MKTGDKVIVKFDNNLHPDVECTIDSIRYNPFVREIQYYANNTWYNCNGREVDYNEGFGSVIVELNKKENDIRN